MSSWTGGKVSMSSRNRKKSRQEIVQSRQQLAVSASYHHSGPIPDPHTLQRYEEILPGAAERILSMAESQSEHRKKMESKVIAARSRDSFLGIMFGLIIAIVTLLCGTYIVVNGYSWSGTILSSAGLVSLVSVFIYGTRSAKKERESKNG